MNKEANGSVPVDRFVRSVPYKSVDFIWVCSHYDLHLNGICNDDGELREFKTDYDTGIVSLYSLTMRQKIKWKLNQWMFELCVGKHWTYPDRGNCVQFYYKWPQWFWKLVFRAYYSRT